MILPNKLQLFVGHSVSSTKLSMTHGGCVREYMFSMCIDETCVKMWNLFIIAELKTKAQPKCVCTRHHFTEHLQLAINDRYCNARIKKVRAKEIFLGFMLFTHTQTKKFHNSPRSIVDFGLEKYFFSIYYILLASMTLIQSAEGIICHRLNFDIYYAPGAAYGTFSKNKK